MRHEGLDYSSPIPFSWRERLILATASPLIAYLFKALGAVSRVELRGKEHVEAGMASGGHALLAVWHDTMGIGLNVFSNQDVHTLTSFSFDGELAAQVAGYFGVEAVRGSTSKGGVRALRSLEKAARLAPLIIITVDGPRGPRRVAQPGLAIVSARTQLPIYPVAIASHPAWRLNSWDRMVIPKPFTRTICACGEAIPPPSKRSGTTIESTRAQLERELNLLQNSLEEELGCPKA